MDGPMRVVQHTLMCLCVLLLPDIALALGAQDAITRQYMRVKEGEQVYSPSRYSSTTTTTTTTTAAENGARRQGIDAILAKFTLQRIASMRSRTGPMYNVSLSPSLHGVTCQVMRLRAGSLRRRGLTFNNFHIPKGSVLLLNHRGGPFVFLIYKSIPVTSSTLLYSLPRGFTFLSPVVGLFIYSSLSSSSFNASSSEIALLSPPLTGPPISVTLPFRAPPSMRRSSMPLCAFFDINGTFSFSNLSSPPFTCSASSLMDSALVLPPYSSSSPSPSFRPRNSSLSINVAKKDPSRPWKVALIAVLACFSGFAVIGVTVLAGMRVQGKCQMAKLLKETDHNQETLHTAVIGHTRAPIAASIRTKPTIETESLRS